MYVFYEDPRHGWLEVPRAELVLFGILRDISPYSYESRDGTLVYLEEDSDLMKFARATGWQYGMTFADWAQSIGGIKTIHHDDNRIRGLPSFGA